MRDGATYLGPDACVRRETCERERPFCVSFARKATTPQLTSLDYIIFLLKLQELRNRKLDL